MKENNYRSVLLGLLLLVIILVIIAGGIAAGCFYVSAHDKTPALRLKGIRTQVIIQRDKYGIPSIQAADEDDLFFATGYVTASDRLWQIMMARAIMQGRLAEIIGSDGLPFDIYIRSLAIGKLIQEATRGLDARTQAILENYARGINAYLETHAILPPEFVVTAFTPEPWKRDDSLYIMAMLAMNLSDNIIEELDYLVLAGRVGYGKAAWLTPVSPEDPLPFDETMKLGSIDPGHLLSIGYEGKRPTPPFAAYFPIKNAPASNNWALSGMKTRNRKTIIANDTHLDLMLPCPWMIMRQTCPAFRTEGLMIPGIPIVLLGYNGSLGWTATMVMADRQDLFIEKISERGGQFRYRHRGEWVPAGERVERIKVRGKTPVTIRMYRTCHGPLLNTGLRAFPFPSGLTIQPLPMTSPYGIALSWELGDLIASFRGFYDLGRATTMAQARKALLLISSLNLNIVYGDARNIAWQVTGQLPIRKRGTGLLPSPGWDGAYDWQGHIPVDRMPCRINPPEGYVATANNKTIPTKYPYTVTSTWDCPERIERIRQLLSAGSQWTAAGVQHMQYDQYSPFARKVQDMLWRSADGEKIRKVISEWGNSPRGMRASEALYWLDKTRFDAEMKSESASAAVFGAFIHAFVRETFLDELGPENGIAWQAFVQNNVLSYAAPQDHLLVRENSPFMDNILTQKIETKHEIVAQSLQQSILLCEKAMGASRKGWHWGRLHTYHWQHDISKIVPLASPLLDSGPYAAGGDCHTINVASYIPGKNFDVWRIPTSRMVIDFNSDEPLQVSIVPGQSSNPASDHYDDMIPLFLSNAQRQPKRTSSDPGTTMLLLPVR